MRAGAGRLPVRCGSSEKRGGRETPLTNGHEGQVQQRLCEVAVQEWRYLDSLPRTKEYVRLNTLQPLLKCGAIRADLGAGNADQLARVGCANLEAVHLVGNVCGGLVDHMVPAVAGHPGACGGVQLGAKEYFGSHAVLGGLFLVHGRLLRMTRSRGCGVERALGNTVERERLIFRSREFARVHVRFKGDFAIAVSGAQERVQ